MVDTRHEFAGLFSLYLWVTGGVVAIVFAVTLFTVIRFRRRADPVRARPGLRVAITGFQWQWRFDYDNGASVLGTRDTLPTLVVPVDTLVRFTARSDDVIHSFWIPSERFKRDVFPYRTTTFDLVFDHEGTLLGHCAEFCGLRHSNMDFYVRVVSADAFRSWERSA